MREIRTSGATRGEVALGVLPYSTVFASKKMCQSIEQSGLFVTGGDFVDDIPESEFSAEAGDLVGISLSIAEEVGRHCHVDVAADSGQFPARSGGVHVFADLLHDAVTPSKSHALEFGLADVFQSPAGRQEFACCFFANTRHSRDVVGRVAQQGQ